jgi:hypothetical protein
VKEGDKKMAGYSSDLSDGQKGKNKEQWRSWGRIGLIAGVIGGVFIYLPAMSILGWSNTILQDAMTFVFALGCFGITILAHLGISYLAGIAGGSLISRLRPKWGNYGAVFGGLIIELILVGVIVYEKVPYLYLPRFEEAGLGSSVNSTIRWEYHVVVSSDFTKEDALKVGNYLQSRKYGVPVDIGFYCLAGYERMTFSAQYMLFEYKKVDKDSPPTISTPIHPSKHDQGTACK